jgi:pyruvate dehydrogenase E1 component beta subunit
MPVMTYRDALKTAMAEEMERDESVVLLGEDIGLYGGTHLVTDGLLDRFGPKRVIDTPIAEGGFTGATHRSLTWHREVEFVVEGV